MEQEISSGTMLGIVLIALAVIIGLGFGIFSVAKGTANEGVTKVQTSLANVSASEFQDYDQTVVTGTQVKSAYQNFEGKNVAVIIATTATIDAGDGIQEGAGIKDTDMEDKIDAYIKVAYNDKDGSKVYQSMHGSVEDAESTGQFINYNALLNCEGGADNKESMLYYNDGSFVCTGGFATIDGDSTNIAFNTNIKNFSKSGMMEYLSPTSKFNSFVIKDSTGSYIGVAFVQISNK